MNARLIRTLILILSVITLFPRCSFYLNPKTPDNHKWQQEVSDSPEINRKIDFYKTTIKRLYSTNPDSAIYYYLKIIDLYHEQNMPYNVFHGYIDVSELYCFRKSDGPNAVYFYGEALKTMNKYGGIEDTNPFFYIDMGNMLYMNNLFALAKKSYFKAVTIATQKKDDFAISVAQNNIGIVYREEGDYNSSCIFFRKSLSLRKQMIPLYEAQNYIYLAKVFVCQNVPDSIQHYRELAMEALNRHTLKPVNPKIITESAAQALVEAFSTYEAELMAIYYDDKALYEQSIYYYNVAFNRAVAFKDYISASSHLYCLATLYDKIHNPKQAIQYAELSYQMAIANKINDCAATSARLLYQLYGQENNLRMANLYSDRALVLTDTLNHQNLSKEKQSAKILLITTQTDDSLKVYRYISNQHRKIMKDQSLAIEIISLLLFLAGILSYLLYNRKTQFKKEYQKRMSLILNNIEEEKVKEQKKNETLETYLNQLEVKLTMLIDIDRVYLQKNISLADLAALLGTNVTYLSRYFNNRLKTNFNDYINLYRVKAACQIFRCDTQHRYSVDQVADMVGFKSRTTFYSAFKRFTGITPAYFQKNISSISTKLLNEIPDK